MQERCEVALKHVAWHKNALAALRSAHSAEKASLHRDVLEAMSIDARTHESALADLATAHAHALTQTTQEHACAVRELADEYAREGADWEGRHAESEERLAAQQAELGERLAAQKAAHEADVAELGGKLAAAQAAASAADEEARTLQRRCARCHWQCQPYNCSVLPDRSFSYCWCAHMKSKTISIMRLTVLVQPCMNTSLWHLPSLLQLDHNLDPAEDQTILRVGHSAESSRICSRHC
jgi:hypothetical protein